MIIGIVGLGLIGGSLGLDWRAQGHRVLGVSRQARTCQRAMERGAVDQASPDFARLGSAEVIVLCPPIAQIVPLLQSLVPHLSPQAIVTDVGSVKTAVVRPCQAYWPRFIGGHPLAGTAAQGIEAAQTALFVGAPYVLTPTEQTLPSDLETLMGLIQDLQAKVHICSPEAHDQAVAWISHLPVMISAGLIAACGQEVDVQIATLAKTLASSGFRDTSRVGGGNPELGLMMAQFNRQALLQSLGLYRQELDQMIEWLQQERWEALYSYLQRVQAERPPFL